MGKEPADFQERFLELENMDWDRPAERRRKCLDDLPWQMKENAKKARVEPQEGAQEPPTRGRGPPSSPTSGK